MAIYTVYGSEVEITETKQDEEGFQVVKARRVNDNTMIVDNCFFSLAYLRADGGIAEIDAALQAVMKAKA